MSKKKNKDIKKNNSICYKIKNFFFPKDFRHEMKKGLYIGSHSKLAPNTETGNPGLLFWIPWQIGKLIRRIIDPKRKLNFKKDVNNNDNTNKEKTNYIK